MCTILRLMRRGDRVVEGARLESGCTARYRGFESLPLRHFNSAVIFAELSYKRNSLRLEYLTQPGQNTALISSYLKRTYLLQSAAGVFPVMFE